MAIPKNGWMDQRLITAVIDGKRKEIRERRAGKERKKEEEKGRNERILTRVLRVLCSRECHGERDDILGLGSECSQS